MLCTPLQYLITLLLLLRWLLLSPAAAALIKNIGRLPSSLNTTIRNQGETVHS
jgi:hypothetical protein